MLQVSGAVQGQANADHFTLADRFAGRLPIGYGTIVDLSIRQARLLLLGEIVLDAFIDGPGFNRREPVGLQILDQAVLFAFLGQPFDGLFFHMPFLLSG